MKKWVIKVFIAFIFVVAVSITALAEANPLPSPLVTIQSPQNNQVYPSESIQLIFTPIADNCTSFSYALDDQPPITTDGHTALTSLNWGSHKLTVYANQTLATMGFVVEGKDMVASIVHFSVVYSNAWVTVVAIILPIVLVISSSLFFKRRQIAIRLRRRKGTMFWFGAVMLALVTSAFILYSYSVVKDYLFPYWPKGISVEIIPYLTFSIISFIFIGVSLALMWWGTRHSNYPTGTSKQD